MKKRHTPIRTCVACRETDEKRDLLRVVRQPDSAVLYDSKGKLSGRGAYVCATAACILLARKQKKLERSLKVTTIPETLFTELIAQAESLGSEAVPESASAVSETALRGRVAAEMPQKSEVTNE